MYKARGVGMTMRRAFVDSDHAIDTTYHPSHTGFFIIFLNSPPIYWYSSQKQTSIKTSSFGLEFIAMKQ